MSAEVILAGIAIAFVAAACYSVTGFGFALVLTPILAVVWDVKPTIVTATILSTVGLIPLLVDARGHVPLGRVSILILGSLTGIPVGVFLLEELNPDAIQILVAVTVIVASVLLYLSPNLVGSRDTTGGRAAAGFLGGALGASTSMGGPPVVLYLLGCEPAPATFRATLVAYFLPGNLLTLAGYVVVDQISSDVLLMSAAAIPAVVVGLIGGAWLRQHVQAERFRTVVLGVLLFSSVVVIATTAAG